MTELYTVSFLLFVLTATTLYTLILNRKNTLALFVLIPLLLTASSYTGYTVYALQGTPIIGQLPEDVQVEVAYVEPAKPWIYLLLRTTESPQPTYYKIPYNEANMKALKGAMLKEDRDGKTPGVKGKFKRTNKSDESDDVYIFMQEGAPNPPKQPEAGPGGIIPMRF